MKTVTRVLLIEHSEEAAAMIGYWLHHARHTFQVTCVDRLQLGLQALHAEKFDAVIVNLDLPDNSGIEGLIRLRARAVDVPVLVLSEAQNSAVQPLIRAGAQECLFMPQLKAGRLEDALIQAIERQHAQSRSARFSTLDPLTQLPNRRGFMHAARQQLNRARRLRLPFVLLLADLDGLKEINERCGNAAGDQALVVFAQALREVFRSSDILARLDGDAFAVLACEARTDSTELLRKRLQFRLENASVGKGLPVLSCSMGAALWQPSRDLTLDQLLREADVALYEHKLRFGPRIKPWGGHRFKPQLSNEAVQDSESRVESIRSLREALQAAKQGADILTQKGFDDKRMKLLDDVAGAVSRADAIIRDLEA